MLIGIHFINAQNGQAERGITNHKVGGNQSTKPLKLMTQTSGARSDPA